METVALIRDIAIILLAILNIVMMAILVIIAFFAYKLVKYGGRELPKLMTTVEDTLHTVQGTTEFLGASLVKPAIGANSTSAAVREFFKAFTGGNRPRGTR